MAFIKRLYDARWAYFFIFPAYIFFIIFTLYPLIKGLSYSFYDVGLASTEWVGLDHFRKMFDSSVFTIALRNTFLIVLGVVPAVIFLSILISVVVFPLTNKIQTFFRVAFYLPTVASGVVLSMVWIWMLNPSYGLINHVLSWVNLGPVEWLGQPGMALISVMVVTLTFILGQPVILYLAGLGGIPTDLYEAAMIDGANAWRRFWKITLPLLKPTTLFVAVTQTMGVFQVFVVIMLLTNGGPANGTQTIVFRMYQTAFSQWDFGYASALGMVLIFIVTIITLLIYRLFGQDVEY